MISNKLANIPDSYFGKTMGRKIEHGPLPLINMAVGIPDGPTPQGIIDHFQKALTIPENQKYGAFHGKEAFKQAIVDFYQRQYNVTLDKEDEVCILYGTKNGLVAVPTCVINPGDYVLLPDPGYTDYLAGVLLADGKPVPLNLEPPHYLPDWSTVDSQIIDKTKLIYLTYPNNPTGSTATKEVFDEAIKVQTLKSCMILLMVLSVSTLKILVYLLRKMGKMLRLKFIPCLKVITCQVLESVLQLVIKI